MTRDEAAMLINNYFYAVVANSNPEDQTEESQLSQMRAYENLQKALCQEPYESPYPRIVVGMNDS